MYPKITVVIPSFNQAEFVGATILSIINQDYLNLEIIVIDGGSSDGSVEIIKRYEKKITYWVSEKDKGQSDALRKGFARATGEILCWLNSDDVFFPGALKKVADVYVQSKADFITGVTAHGAINNGGINICAVPPPVWTWNIECNLFGIGQMSTFFTKRLYEKVNGVNPDLFYRMDSDLFYRMILTKPKIQIINSVLGFIRYHNATKTTNFDKVRKQELLKHLTSKNIKMKKYQNSKYIYHLLRFLSGSVFKSALLTKQFKNKKMEEIWDL